MSALFIGTLISWIILIVITLAILFWILRVLYRRSTKETSFVRTGLFGEKVVIDGGAFVWPMVHNITLVNMSTLQLSISRTNEHALITKDRMRVDVEADFYVRVAKTKIAVSSAATTLGARTMRQESLLDLLSGRFVSSLREVAAEMSMEEIHENRSSYVARVKAAALDALAENGLELESVAITEFDQTGLEYFNPSNRFDAEGLTKLISDIEDRRQTRNDIEQTASVAIRSRNLEAEKRANEISVESESSRLSQEREVERLRAEQRMIVAKEQSERSAEAEAAKLAAVEATETHRINQERAVNKARIASELEIRKHELARQSEVETSEIELHKKLEIERIEQDEALSLARIQNEAKLRSQQIATEEEIRKREIARERSEQEEVIASERAVESAKIAREQDIAQERIMSDALIKSVELKKSQEIEKQKIEKEEKTKILEISQAETLKTAEIARDRALDRLEVERQAAIHEVEIGTREEVERARILSERGLDEARINHERDRSEQEILRDKIIAEAQLDKEIAIATKSLEEAAAQIKAEAARAQLAVAEEEVLSARATEEVKRRRSIELTLADKDAEATKLRASGEEVAAKVKAEAQKLIYEAENMLSDDARKALFRSKMLEHVEGIIAASVKPMEKIGDIKIMQMSGMNDGSSGNGKNMTDEVIDSALRYRVQAPMIDQLLSEIGIEGGSLAKMGGLIREARDLDSISKSQESKNKEDKK